MRVIRDEELGGIMMIPLFVDWHIRRCNVDGCKNRPSTIVADAHPDAPTFGICEEHFQAANKPGGGVMYHFVFDDFDAFEYERKASEAVKENSHARPD